MKTTTQNPDNVLPKIGEPTKFNFIKRNNIKEIAKEFGCSARYVRLIIDGSRQADSHKARQVKLAAERIDKALARAHAEVASLKDLDAE